MEHSAKMEMIQKITKLLNLSDEGKNENPHEREVAKRMAAKLMAEHAISFFEIEANGNGQEKKPALTEEQVGSLTQKYRKWEGLLGLYIAQTWDSEIVLTKKFDGNTIINFLGHKSDIEMVKYFFLYLRRTVGVKERLYKGRSKNDYTFGMVNVLGQRLKELYKVRQEVTPSECRDLIVVKKDAVSAFVKQKYPRLKHTKYKHNYSQSLRDGMRDGHEIDLSRPCASNGKRTEQLN